MPPTWHRRTSASFLQMPRVDRRAAGLGGRLHSTAEAAGFLSLSVFAVPVVERVEAGDQADAAEGDLVRARVVADVARLAGAIGEIGEPAVARPEHVRDTRSGRAGDDRS